MCQYEVFNVRKAIFKKNMIGTMHKICKVRGSNPGHHKKKMIVNNIFLVEGERKNARLQS